MIIKNKITLYFPNKLALGGSSTRLSRNLLAAGHIMLASNILTIYFGIFPILGIFSAAIFFIIEHQRKQLLAKDALFFAYKRMVIHVIIVISIILFMHYNNHWFQGYSDIQFWNLALFILAPMSIYDAYCTLKGKLGIRFAYDVINILKQLRNT